MHSVNGATMKNILLLMVLITNFLAFSSQYDRCVLKSIDEVFGKGLKDVESRQNKLYLHYNEGSMIKELRELAEDLNLKFCVEIDTKIPGVLVTYNLVGKVDDIMTVFHEYRDYVPVYSYSE